MINKFNSIPRAEIIEYLKGFKGNIDKVSTTIINDRKDEIPALGLLKVRLSKGKEVSELFCPICKKWHKINSVDTRFYSSRSNIKICPECGNKVEIYSSYYNFRQNTASKPAIIGILDNGCILISDVYVSKVFNFFEERLSPSDISEKSPDEIADILTGEHSFECGFSNYNIIIPGKGMHKAVLDYGNIKIKNNFEHLAVFELDCYIDNDESIVNDINKLYDLKTKNITEAIKNMVSIDNENHNDTLRSKASARKSKTDDFNNSLYNLELNKYDFDKIDWDLDALYFIDDENDNEFGGYYICPKDSKKTYINISKDMLSDSSREDKFVCPICGETHSIRVQKKARWSTTIGCSNRVIALEFSNEWLIVRLFTKNISFDYDKKKETVNVGEERYYYNGKKCIEFNINCDDGSYTVSNHSKFDYVRTSSKFLQSEEEIADAIKASSFNRCGLLEAWGLNPLVDSKVESIFSFKYLNYYFENPFIEQIVKCGLRDLTQDIIRGISFQGLKPELMLNSSATTAAEILKVSKSDFSVIRKNNFNFYVYKKYVEMKEVDSSLKLEDFLTIMNDRNHNPERFLFIARNYHISVAKQLDYCQKMYDHQCIPYSEGIVIWSDYLDMGTKLRYDFTDKNILYPTSLKKEHDIAAFAYENIKEQIKKEQFKEAVEEAKCYIYKNKDFLIKIPNDPEEVVNEGKTLKHCVASYVNKIAAKNCVICFIRKKDEPDTSFYTVEIDKNNYIVQIKGFCNCAPTDEVFDFVQEWADAKKLTLNKRYY